MEMANDATVIARGPRSEKWRIGGVPMIASPCRCGTPAYLLDELETRCVKCGRRPPGL